MFGRITVAIDGSEPAEEALTTAIDLAQHYGSELTVFAVAPIVPVFTTAPEMYGPPIPMQTQGPQYRAFVERGVQRAKAAGVKSVTGIAEEGVVVDAILDHLDRHATDLLVVGSRGLTATRRVFLGSVSSAVTNHAPCPVLVVRPPPAKSTKPAHR